MAAETGEFEALEPWERGELAAQRLNQLLHEGIGQSPCETACTHVLSSGVFPGATMLGIANVFGRVVEQAVLSGSEGAGS